MMDKTHKVRSMGIPKCPACFEENTYEQREQRENVIRCSKCGTLFSVECEITYYTKLKELGKGYNLPFSLGDKITLINGTFLSSIHKCIECDEEKCWGTISSIDFNYHTPLYYIDWVVEPASYYFTSFTYYEMKKFKGGLK